MRFLYAIALVFFSSSAHALTETEKNQYYPTQKEVYEDCKMAVALADQDKLEEFYATRCAIQLTASLSTIYKSLVYTPITPTNAKEQGEIDSLEQLWQRFCVLKKLNKKELPEPQLAKRFVEYVERHNNDPQYKASLNERSPFTILTAFNDPCTAEHQ